MRNASQCARRRACCVQVPGLVQDGCRFSYEQTKIFVDFAMEKYRGAPADAGLKAALADNEDGGAASSSTSYEAK